MKSSPLAEKHQESQPRRLCCWMLLVVMGSSHMLRSVSSSSLCSSAESHRHAHMDTHFLQTTGCISNAFKCVTHIDHCKCVTQEFVVRDSEFVAPAGFSRISKHFRTAHFLIISNLVVPWRLLRRKASTRTPIVFR